MDWPNFDKFPFIKFVMDDFASQPPSKLPEKVLGDTFLSPSHWQVSNSRTVRRDFMVTSDQLGTILDGKPRLGTPEFQSEHQFGSRVGFNVLFVFPNLEDLAEFEGAPNTFIREMTIEDFLKECVRKDQGLAIQIDGATFLIEPDRAFDYVRNTFPDFIVQLQNEGLAHATTVELTAQMQSQLEDVIADCGWVQDSKILRMRYGGKDTIMIPVMAKYGIGDSELMSRASELVYELGQISDAVALSPSPWRPIDRPPRSISDN